MGAAFLQPGHDPSQPHLRVHLESFRRRRAGAWFEDALTPGEWIHVVAVYDPGDMGTTLAGVRIYKNGVLRKGPPDPGTLYGTYDIVPADGSAPVRFATRDGNSFLTGGLDEVAIYPRVLTGAEIMENYTAGTS